MNKQWYQKRWAKKAIGIGGYGFLICTQFLFGSLESPGDILVGILYAVIILMVGNTFLQVYAITFSEKIPAKNITSQVTKGLVTQHYNLYSSDDNQIIPIASTPLPKTVTFSCDSHRLLVQGVMDLKIFALTGSSLALGGAFMVYFVAQVPEFSLTGYWYFLGFGLFCLIYTHILPYRGNLVFDRDSGTVYFPRFLFAKGYTVPFDQVQLHGDRRKGLRGFGGYYNWIFPKLKPKYSLFARTPVISLEFSHEESAQSWKFIGQFMDKNQPMPKALYFSQVLEALQRYDLTLESQYELENRVNADPEGELYWKLLWDEKFEDAYRWDSSAILDHEKRKKVIELEEKIKSLTESHSGLMAQAEALLDVEDMTRDQLEVVKSMRVTRKEMRGEIEKHENEVDALLGKKQLSS